MTEEQYFALRSMSHDPQHGEKNCEAIEAALKEIDRLWVLEASVRRLLVEISKASIFDGEVK